MSIFSDILDGGEAAVDDRSNDIGAYLANVVTDTFIKRGDPPVGNQTPAQIAQTQQAAKTTALMKLAIPIGVVLLAAVFFFKRR